MSFDKHIYIMADKCVLPSLQMTSLYPPKKKMSVSAADVMQNICANVRLVALSLLLSTESETVVELADCIAIVRSKIKPRISCGQLYFLPQWRIRHEHMSLHIQNIILHCSASENELEEAAKVYYEADKIEKTVLQIIGKARSAGAQALLQKRVPC